MLCSLQLCITLPLRLLLLLLLLPDSSPSSFPSPPGCSAVEAVTFSLSCGVKSAVISLFFPLPSSSAPSRCLPPSSPLDVLPSSSFLPSFLHLVSGRLVDAQTRSRAQCTLRTRYGATVRSDTAVVLCGFACATFQCTTKMSHFGLLFIQFTRRALGRFLLDKSRIYVTYNAAETVDLFRYLYIFCTFNLHGSH